MKSSNRLEQLRLAIHGVNAPFSCTGSFVPENTLALRLKDGTRFVVERRRHVWHPGGMFALTFLARPVEGLADSMGLTPL